MYAHMRTLLAVSEGSIWGGSVPGGASAPQITMEPKRAHTKDSQGQVPKEEDTLRKKTHGETMDRKKVRWSNTINWCGVKRENP